MLCAFGSFFVVQALKTVMIPKRLGGLAKLVLALLTSAGAAAALYPHHYADLVLYGVAGAGLAVLIHRVARAVSVAGDWFIREIMRKGRN
jgi:hypothetical protein